MTMGQRIAQKRKEQGLSQEGLGEQLGVSRQAIYKWESGAAVPEIDKLIALSRLSSVYRWDGCWGWRSCPRKGLKAPRRRMRLQPHRRELRAS